MLLRSQPISFSKHETHTFHWLILVFSLLILILMIYKSGNYEHIRPITHVLSYFYWPLSRTWLAFVMFSLNNMNYIFNKLKRFYVEYQKDIWMSNKYGMSDSQGCKTARLIKISQQVFKSLKNRLSWFFSEWFSLSKSQLLLVE